MSDSYWANFPAVKSHNIAFSLLCVALIFTAVFPAYGAEIAAPRGAKTAIIQTVSAPAFLSPSGVYALPTSQVALIAIYQREAFLTLKIADMVEQRLLILNQTPFEALNFATLAAQYEHVKTTYEQQIIVELVALQAASVAGIPTGSTLIALRDMLGLTP